MQRLSALCVGVDTSHSNLHRATPIFVPVTETASSDCQGVPFVSHCPQALSALGLWVVIAQTGFPGRGRVRISTLTWCSDLVTVSERAGGHVGLGKMSAEYKMPRLGEEPLFRGRSDFMGSVQEARHPSNILHGENRHCVAHLSGRIDGTTD